MFLPVIFHDVAIQVCFGLSVFDKHTFDFHEFIAYMRWRFFKLSQVIQTQDFIFGGEE